MRTLLLNFACKKPKYADTCGRGSKLDALYGWPLMCLSSTVPGVWIFLMTVIPRLFVPRLCPDLDYPRCLGQNLVHTTFLDEIF